MLACVRACMHPCMFVRGVITCENPQLYCISLNVVETINLVPVPRLI